MPVRVDTFGYLGDHPVRRIILDDGRGLSATVVELGARLTELHVPDRAGKTADIVLGFDAVDGYLATKSYAGSTAGRYANRIARGRFELDGRAYALSRNEGNNHLHGGCCGFDKMLWRGDVDEKACAARFAYRSPGGEEGYPGTLDAEVEYRLPGDGSLVVEMSARTDAPTIINLVNHSYFNMAGHASGSVADQILSIDADAYTPVDGELIPTGAIAPVRGTPFDFTASKPIGTDFAGGLERGYDHNWVLRKPAGAVGLRRCAEAADPASGRRLELWTSEPGVQVYTGGYFDGSESGKGGCRYGRFAGFTLETQKFPDSPNRPAFPSARLDPGETYRHRMEFRLRPE